jgi:hypothetical protein
MPLIVIGTTPSFDRSNGSSGELKKNSPTLSIDSDNVYETLKGALNELPPDVARLGVEPSVAHA